MKQKIKIAIVSNAMLMREGLARLMQSLQHLEVLFHASNKPQVLSHLKYKLPDIILLSAETLQVDYLELLTALKAYPQIRMITLMEEVSDALISQLLEQGVKAILTKSTTLETLVKAIKEVHNEGFYYTEEIIRVIDRRVDWSTISSAGTGITTREAEVLHLVCQGKSSRQIAGLLFISIKTVENHRYNLLRKTSSKNQIELKQWAASLHDYSGAES